MRIVVDLVVVGVVEISIEKMVPVVQLAWHCCVQIRMQIVIVAVGNADVVANSFRRCDFSVPPSRCNWAILAHIQIIRRILRKLMKRQHVLRNSRWWSWARSR